MEYVCFYDEASGRLVQKCVSHCKSLEYTDLAEDFHASAKGIRISQEYLHSKELNSMEVKFDLKSSPGYLSYRSRGPLLPETG